MFPGEIPGQPLYHPSGLLRLEGLVQGGGSMSVQSLPRTRYGVIKHHPDLLRFRVGGIRQPAHLMGEVFPRSLPWCDARSLPRASSPPAAHKS